jgi:chromosome segregation ATPase
VCRFPVVCCTENVNQRLKDALVGVERTAQEVLGLRENVETTMANIESKTNGFEATRQALVTMGLRAVCAEDCAASRTLSLEDAIDRVNARKVIVQRKLKKLIQQMHSEMDGVKQTSDLEATAAPTRIESLCSDLRAAEEEKRKRDDTLHSKVQELKRLSGLLGDAVQQRGNMQGELGRLRRVNQENEILLLEKDHQLQKNSMLLSDATIHISSLETHLDTAQITINQQQSSSLTKDGHVRRLKEFSDMIRKEISMQKKQSVVLGIVIQATNNRLECAATAFCVLKSECHSLQKRLEESIETLRITIVSHQLTQITALAFYCLGNSSGQRVQYQHCTSERNVQVDRSQRPSNVIHELRDTSEGLEKEVNQFKAKISDSENGLTQQLLASHPVNTELREITDGRVIGLKKQLESSQGANAVLRGTVDDLSKRMESSRELVTLHSFKRWSIIQATGFGSNSGHHRRLS